ncbi:MAG: hypothetical protein GF331_22970 [Chitinivibrionales bacterium]|nr:hypothetical protein [Chitinivibrionales bacterium]
MNKDTVWNSTCLITDGMLGGGSVAAIGIHTIIPTLMSNIAHSYPPLQQHLNLFCTLLVVCFQSLMPVTSFLFGSTFESHAVRKPRFLVLSALVRIPFILLAVATLYMRTLGYVPYLVMVIVSFLMWSLVNGALMPQWFDFVARLIPVRVRGRIFVGRNIMGKLSGLAVVAFFPMINNAFPFPTNFGLLVFHVPLPLAHTLNTHPEASPRPAGRAPGEVGA